jgi:hypothetical protein
MKQCKVGRPPNWLRERCKDLVDRQDLLNFLVEVAKGKDVESTLGPNGERIFLPAKVRDRMEAIKELIDRGWGKPLQEMSHEVKTKTPEEIAMEEKRYTRLHNYIKELTKEKEKTNG